MMNAPLLTSRNSKLCNRDDDDDDDNVSADENGNTLRHMTSDFTKQADQGHLPRKQVSNVKEGNRAHPRRSSTSGDPFSSAQPHTSSTMSGHINAFFCCQDEEDYFQGPVTLRVDHSRMIGGRGERWGELQDVTDLHVVGHNDLLVTDFVGSRIQMFSKDTGLGKTFSHKDLVELWACCPTKQHNHLAVTSRRSNSLVLVNPASGVIMNTIGEDHLSCPSGVALSSSGTFVVTDFKLQKVFAFSSSGEFLQELITTPSGNKDINAPASFHQPRYVTVSSKTGDVIVSDSGNHRLVVFDRDLNFLWTIGKFGKHDGGLKFPHAVCCDPLGNIYVADRYNDRVTAFSRRGEFLRHVLTSSEHKLRHPQGLALSANGQELYVSHGGVKAHTVSVFKLSCG